MSKRATPFHPNLLSVVRQEQMTYGFLLQFSLGVGSERAWLILDWWSFFQDRGPAIEQWLTGCTCRLTGCISIADSGFIKCYSDNWSHNDDLNMICIGFSIIINIKVPWPWATSKYYSILLKFFIHASYIIANTFRGWDSRKLQN